jgi:hypothetical protein
MVKRKMGDKSVSRGSKSDDLRSRLDRIEAALAERYASAPADDAYAELERRISAIEKRVLEDSPSAREPVRSPVDGGPVQQCVLPKIAEPTFGANVSPGRARLVRTLSKRWVNGTKLRYYFFEGGREAGGNQQRDIVREGFEVWKKLGIGIEFEEVGSISSADIRIGFVLGDGAWSYVGRDVVDVPGKHERTMNFGWDLARDPRRADVAVHEIGHTLGFEHEHQNPFSGIVWDEEAVYRYFAATPNNWDRATTEYNILRKLEKSELTGSQWDPDSIMHYDFAAGLIREPAKYRSGLRPPLDPSTAYPELKPHRSQPHRLAPAEQVDYSIFPTETRQYTLQTFGGADTVLVLFEDQNGDLRYVTGDDDSGTDRNASITTRLNAGTRYVARLRMYYAFESGEISLMLS